MPYLTLELDPAFRDFNFARIPSPDFPVAVSAKYLHEALQRVKNGERGAAAELADAILTTLRRASFEAFLRAHSERPIDYRDWCLAKCGQFFGVLGVGLDPEELLAEREVEALADLPWIECAQAAVLPTGEAESAIGALLDVWQEQTTGTAQEHREWARNRERNEVVRSCLARGMERPLVCRELDRRAVPVLPILEKLSVFKWEDGWADPELRENIQQLFSKLRLR